MRRCLTAGALLLLLFYLACDHGLAPRPVSGIQGTISFQHWPPADSLHDLRLVVFRSFPPTNVVLEVLSGQAFVYPPIDSTHLPYFVDRVDYFLELPPGRYEYVVVAQQYGPNVFSDWRAVGQYDVDTDSLPTPITVPEGQIVSPVDIQVDFKKLPIQPF
ncbi:MAG: hypothetical protein D6715_03550 [Calditrichaeota bacterium]|nr:MAG: hypothetical protein D6715_03550 [Calditrichota bacterium]